jgi:segregation and condensation protein B
VSLDLTTDRIVASQMLLDGSMAEPAIPEAELMALMEALLLVSAEPPTVDDLAAIAGVDVSRIDALVSTMSSDSRRGWIVQRHGNRLHLATAPRFAAHISRYLGLEREGRLSSAALETLAIIAWQQPITRSEIEAVRGVDCAGVIATLHGRELIEPLGRVQTAGNPYQYGTTVGFLNAFGLTSLDDLPSPGLLNGEDAVELLRAATADGTEPDDRVIEIA